MHGAEPGVAILVRGLLILCKWDILYTSIKTMEAGNMIVLNVTYRLSKENQPKFIAALKERNISALTQAEPGCLKYSFYAPIESDDEVVLIENWQDMESLTRHIAGENIKALGAMKVEFGLETVIKKYESED